MFFFGFQSRDALGQALALGLAGRQRGLELADAPREGGRVGLYRDRRIELYRHRRRRRWDRDRGGRRCDRRRWDRDRGGRRGDRVSH